MENNQNTEQTLNPATDPAGTGDKSEKLFTQAEVNEIVRKRLEKVKQDPPAPREPTELEKREAALAAKESRIQCQEYLIGNNLPMQLLDILDTSNPNEFNKRAEMVNSLIRAAKGSDPLFEPSRGGAEFDIDAAFAKVGHKPKDYRPRNI